MKKPKSSFRDKVTGNTQKQKSEAKSYGYLKLPSDVHVFSVSAGDKVVLDFLPYLVTDPKHPDRDADHEIAVPDTLWYKRPFKVHRNVGADNDTVVCPTSFGKKCPICEYGQKRFKEGADQEELKALRAGLRNLYIVVPIGHKKFEEVPHIWDMSQYLFQNLLNEEIEENPDLAVFPDLEEGVSLKIRFETKTLGKNKFEDASRIDPVEREQGYDEDILEKVPNLDEVLRVLSYDELAAKFFDVDEPDADEDTDSTPHTKSTNKKTTKQVEDEGDDEDEKTTRTKKTAEPEKRSSEKHVEKTLPDSGFDWDGLLDMTQSRLEKLIKGYSLGIDADDYDDDIMALRKAIAKEMDIEIPREKKTESKSVSKTKPKPEPVKNCVQWYLMLMIILIWKILGPYQ